MNFEKVCAIATSECAYLDEGAATRILVGSRADDTAGRLVVESLRKEIARRGLRAEVISTGSAGYYDLEPTVLIERPGVSSILYNNATPETCLDLVNDCVVKGNPRPDLAVCSLSGQPVDGVPGMSTLPLFRLQRRIALRNCGYIDPADINHYILRGGGYGGLARCLQMSPADVIEELRAAKLRGRGGGGYPAADKWQICREAQGEEKYLVCNAVDADPQACTARLLLESDPHSVLEGMLIGAYAVGAARCIICLSDACNHAAERVAAAIKQMRKYTLLGDGILDSPFATEIEIKAVPRSFASGEETALLALLAGGEAMPYLRLTYPATKGLEGKPTLVNNVETFANVSAIFEMGPARYSAIGTEQSRGSKIVTLAGEVVHAYTVEVPLGTPLRSVIGDIGGGVRGGKRLKAIRVGGPTGAFFRSDSLSLGVDYEAIQGAGSIVGSGSIELFNEDACAVEMAGEAMQYIESQSCGKCVFCREGSRQMSDILKEIAADEGSPQDLELLADLGEAMRVGSICGLGRTAPNPVLSSIGLFRGDYDVHIGQKRCPVAGNAGGARGPVGDNRTQGDEPLGNELWTR